MRDVHEWFGLYAASHRDPANRLIHWVCVPLMLWSTVALLWLIPVSPRLGKPGLWAAAAMLALFAFYQRLSRRVGLAMVPVLIVCGVASDGLRRLLGPQDLLWVALVVLVASLLGQLAGHRVEGSKPAFLSDATHLLIAPAWLAGQVLQRLGIRW